MLIPETFKPSDNKNSPAVKIAGENFFIDYFIGLPVKIISLFSKRQKYILLT